MASCEETEVACNLSSERPNALAGAAFGPIHTLVSRTFYHLHVFAMVISLGSLLLLSFRISPPLKNP
jgi:hypothetical protein